MSIMRDSLSPTAVCLLEALTLKLDAIEAELKRLGWWSDHPPDLQAEVAAGRLKSWRDAPGFELWLQCVFLPNARARVAEVDLPSGSSVGEMARRQYDYHSHVPEAMPLMGLLQGFDAIVGAWNEHQGVAVTNTFEGAEPEPEPEPRRQLPPLHGGEGLDFENVLLSRRREMLEVLDEVEREAGTLLQKDEDETLRWLAGEFPGGVRPWLMRGQVPPESRVAEVAEREWSQRGVKAEMAGVLERLVRFDSLVKDWHVLSPRLEAESAPGRIRAAWRCIMSQPTLEQTAGAEPDIVRYQILLTLNRVEAELRLTGWWSETAPVLPPESAGTLEYSAGSRDRNALPPYAHWLQSSLLPALRERVQKADLPKLQRMSDDANRALSEERLGAERYRETRRLYNAMTELTTLLERAWPAAQKRYGEVARLRGLTAPPSATAEKAAAEMVRFRADVAEAVEKAMSILTTPLWQARDVSGDPPPFEHWLRMTFLPDVITRLKDGRVLELRRVSDYAVWECRLLGLTEAAEGLLVALEKVDHWSAHANRALREMWEG